MKKNTTQRTFKCTECGITHSAAKKSSRRTPTGHIKTMYCWKCKQVTDFKQVSEFESRLEI